MNFSSIMRWRVAGLLLAMLIIVGMPFAVTRENANATELARAWVTHSTAVRSLTYRIGYIARDSEAAIYRLLAGDANAQTQARAARAAAEIPDLLQQMRSMARDDLAQQTMVDALENTISGHLVLIARAQQQLLRGDASAARESLREADDLFPVNDKVNTIVQNENRLLAVREKAASDRAFNGQLVRAITALAQLLLLAIIVVASERQIGQRRKAEDRESRAVQRSRLIFQAVREPIALFDADLRSVLVNNAFSELYGEDPQQPARLLAEIGDGAWDDTALLQRLQDVLLHDRELWDRDVVQHTADGQVRHVVVNAHRFQHEGGDQPALLLTVSDVTARALTEQKVIELNRQLEVKVAQVSDINRALETFSYSVSHDLRAPLRHIAGFARKLEQHLGDRVDETAAHYLTVIGSAAEHMAQLIDDLLMFSRLGRGPLRLAAADMQMLVAEARTLAEEDQGDRRVVWKIGVLPTVIGDANKLRIVWQNLLSNAVKYTAHCKVAQIEVSASQGTTGDYEFTVADNGVGFDMQYADNLFGVFQRLHRASEFPGNGIGLASVRRIVTRHGGRVWAEAELGHGARFHFSLPATDAAGTHQTESGT